MSKEVRVSSIGLDCFDKRERIVCFGRYCCKEVYSDLSASERDCSWGEGVAVVGG